MSDPKRTLGPFLYFSADTQEEAMSIAESLIEKVIPCPDCGSVERSLAQNRRTMDWWMLCDCAFESLAKKAANLPN